jgi:hypothetical protein
MYLNSFCYTSSCSSNVIKIQHELGWHSVNMSISLCLVRPGNMFRQGQEWTAEAHWRFSCTLRPALEGTPGSQTTYYECFPLFLKISKYKICTWSPFDWLNITRFCYVRTNTIRAKLRDLYRTMHSSMDTGIIASPQRKELWLYGLPKHTIL